MILSSPKGFKDYLPTEALKRKIVLDRIKEVFARFGFDPLETPTLEYEETLTGKYGEEEKLIYKFETPGGDKVALKYDQTVPLSRVVAEYGPQGKQVLPIPFKRYQIQSAYRGENTQKGRYREFTQCDADIVGISSPLADAEILAIVYEIYKALGLDIVIKINDRSLISDIEPKYLAALDKLDKIGDTGVLQELENRGLSAEAALELFEKVTTLKPSENLSEIIKLFGEMGYPETSLEFDPMLIRGLDYYTGLIIETKLKSNTTASSLGGGGRYDNMIGSFTGTNLPAVGYSVGLDRTIEAMEETAVLKTPKTSTIALVAVFPELLKESLNIATQLRSSGISTEIYLDPQSPLNKQMRYADNKGIPYIIIVGSEEIKTNEAIVKNLITGSSEKVKIEKVASYINEMWGKNPSIYIFE